MPHDQSTHEGALWGCFGLFAVGTFILFLAACAVLVLR